MAKNIILHKQEQPAADAPNSTKRSIYDACNDILHRILYWLTIITFLWFVFYIYVVKTPKGKIWFETDIASTLLANVAEKYKIRGGRGALLISFVPVMLVASISTLLLTNRRKSENPSILTDRPSSKNAKSHKQQAPRRQTSGENVTKKKNQFGIGEMNHDYLAIFLMVIPSIFYIVFGMKQNLESASDIRRALRSVANTFGLAGALMMSFFLIPVTRHSVLLVTLGWSPVHALRLHIWSGWASFIWIVIHSILYICTWFVNNDTPLHEQIIPAKICWSWKAPDDGFPRSCRGQFYQLTGIVSLVFFLGLFFSSLNWFRRKNYRLFYILHVTTAAGMLITAILHWKPLVIYLIPSIVYYLASTTPTLVQAVASKLNGGVKISKAIVIPDSGGCAEIHLQSNAQCHDILTNGSGWFVKLCVPRISLVWHPFTVYNHPEDPYTVRLLYREYGDFTKQLTQQLQSNPYPLTIVDGFYHGPNWAESCQKHDVITMVAGSIGITPFLSTLYSLMKEPTSDGHFVLHWASRADIGLIKFMWHTYLKGMLSKAQECGMDLKIVVHFTGTIDDEMPIDKIICSESLLSFEEKSTSSIEDGVAVIAPNKDKPVVVRPLQGHEFEVARLMPAYYSKILQNVPAFLATSTVVWIGFYVISYWHITRTIEFNILAGYFWGTLIATLVSIGVAILLEAGYHVHRKLNGTSGVRETAALAIKNSTSSIHNKNDYVSIESDPKEPGGGDVDIMLGNKNVSGKIEILTGRPTVEQLFAHAHMGEAPAFYICGPYVLKEMIESEASKENSLLRGYTRYSIYHEPFEM